VLISRWKAVDRWLALILIAGQGGAALAADVTEDWFGPACRYTQEAPAEIPVITQQLLLQVYTRPDEAGATIVVLQTVDGALWVTADSLRQWDAPAPQKFIDYRELRWYALDAITHLRYRYDACTQSLWMDTAAMPKALARFALTSAAEGESLRGEPGGYLNLDTQYISVTGAHQLAALGELGLFNQSGYGGSTFLLGSRRTVRLDTNWNRDDPGSLQRLTLGDGITRSSQFGQSVRFGGVQWGRAFSLRPDLITFPQPNLRGNAALPSTVDVYVNQVLRAHQDVPAGPFELTQVPVVVGQGQVQLVTRDVLGRESIVAYPIYTSQMLLREGLTDFTLEAGWQRRNYAITSGDYGPFLAAGTWRAGVTDRLTTELRAEESAGHPGLSTGLTWLVPALGSFSAGVAASRADSLVGGSYALGFQRIALRWSVAAELRRADSRYTRIGDGGNATRASDLASVGLNLDDAGSLSLTALRQVRDIDGSSRVVSLGYNLRVLRNLFANLSLTRTQGSDVNHLALLSLFYNFGANTSVNAQLQRDDRTGYQEQLTLQKGIGGVLGYGYQAALGFGANPRRSASAQWAQEQGTLSAGLDQFGGTRGYQVGYSTGLAWLNRQIFVTRPVTGNFAVVDTQGVPDVAVYADEHLVGRTGADGLLLVSNLRAYDNNHVRIDDADVPIRYQLDTAFQSVILPLRGASRVVFSVKRTLNVQLRLRLASGEPVPAGSMVIQADAGGSMPVGFDGKVYLADAERLRSLTVQWPEHRCRADWTPPADSGMVLDVICREIK
jgi:outer membrane usher protein